MTEPDGVDATLTPLQDGDGEMPTTTCPQCKYPIEVSVKRRGGHAGIHAIVIMTCTRCDRSWSAELQDDELQGVRQDRHSNAIDPGIPPGIREDILEAEKALFAGCYKATMVMSRRALQLLLEELGAEGRTLGPVLSDARKRGLITDGQFALGTGIKDYGDGGAHRRVNALEHEAEMVLGVTVQLADEIWDANRGAQ